MGKLKDFLAAEGDKLLAEADAEAAAQRQWFESVNGLLTMIEGWIRAADAKGVIHLERDTTLGLDRVTIVPRLRIEAGARAVHVFPSSRGVAGLYAVPGVESPMKCGGMVDMLGPDRTQTLLLFRVGGRDSWHVRTGGSTVKPLTPELFEAFLTDFLQ